VSVPAKKHGAVLSSMVRCVCQQQPWPLSALLTGPVRGEPAATSLSHVIFLDSSRGSLWNCCNKPSGSYNASVLFPLPKKLCAFSCMCLVQGSW